MRIRRLLLLIAAIAICVVVLYFVFSMAGQQQLGGNPSQLRINEVMSSNKGAVPDENGDFPDWVELYNPTSADIDIGGFGLSDDLLSAAKWAFPAGTKVPANGYLVVYCSGDVKNGALHASFKLSSTDVVILSNASGVAIDNVQLVSVASNATLGRDSSGAFVEMQHPSPGFPNTEEGVLEYRATMQLDMQDNGVRINEFMASNATTLPGPQGDYPDWIELYNTTDAPVDISGCGLSDDVSSPMKWVFPAGSTIDAKSVLLIYCSGRDGLFDGALHAPFGLRAYAEDVVFAGKNGAVIDSYSYTGQESDISMARTPDGTGAFAPSSQPTPGYLNTDEGFTLFSATSTLPLGPVVLSELLCNNASFVFDGLTSDYIELYNPSAAAVNLAGYALSDNPKNPAKWVFPDVTIDAGAYMLLLATGNDVRDTQKKNLETNFGLSTDGEVVLLYDPAGILVDKLAIRNAGADVSYGRSGSTLLYYDAPTPGAKNEGGYPGVTAKPLFETSPGIYEQAIELALSTKSGARIYYTTDCTTPTTASSLYSGPLHLASNTVVRAIAVQDGHLTSADAVGTFLFRQDEVNHTLPVVSLVTDPANLWDSKTGIYAYGDSFDPEEPFPRPSANFYKGKSSEAEQALWERTADFALFDENGLQAFTQRVDMRIAGSYGRGNAQKGINLVARSEYGNSRMEYAFFDERAFTSYKALVLRAGGQDQRMSKIRDELSTGLLEGTDVHILYQAYEPCILYLNGEYWGVYFLKEKRNRFFVAQHEGLEAADNMDLIKSEKNVYYGSSADWTSLMQYVSAHDLSQQEAYRYVEERVDLESFMDYMICEIYVANSDVWNIQYYKVNGGKWKWIYYDFCWSWGNTENGADHKTLSIRRLNTKPCSDLFNALLKNTAWRDAFIRRFATLMDTVYAPERVNALVDELAAAIEPELVREREKFNSDVFMGVKQAPESIASADVERWRSQHIQKIRDFANNRPAAMKAQLQSEFHLSDSYMQEVFS